MESSQRATALSLITSACFVLRDRIVRHAAGNLSPPFTMEGIGEVGSDAQVASLRIQELQNSLHIKDSISMNDVQEQ